jgi:hypothetical protein
MAKIKFLGKDGRTDPFAFPKLGVTLTPGVEYELHGKIARPLINGGLAVEVPDQRTEPEPKVEAKDKEGKSSEDFLKTRFLSRKSKRKHGEEIGKPLETEGTEE